MKRTAKRMTERERLRAVMKRMRIVRRPVPDSQLDNPLEDWSWRIWQAAKRDERRRK